ncbi:uncharacterized protein RSE6_12506 [Rhynchosporium secalis]|uniref:Uncharacterized protein n=1 Tax=Rhynchosporium secalis TaxID=38038 RepID=A0A1E1MQN2_RHYSE|nr:uncharacterized protein RSE6_12506 [Rhynchosporium secalis]
MSILPEFIQYVSQIETRKYPSYVNLVTNPAHENYYRVYGGEDPTGNQSGKLPEVGRAGDSRAASSEVDTWVPAKARKASSTEPRFSPYLLQLEGDLQRGITSGYLICFDVPKSNYKLKKIKRASIDKAIEVNI